MKRRSTLYFVILLSPIFVILSCEKVLNVKIPYNGDEYVIYGELPLGEPVSVYVTKTSAVNGTLDFEVNLQNLTVILYENDEIIDTLELVDNIVFKSDSQKKTMLNKRYFVNVFDTNGQLIAQTQFQTPTKMVEELSIKVKPENIAGLNVGIAAREIVINVKDQDEVDNYYSYDIIPYVNGIKSGLTTFAIGKNPDVVDDCGYFFRNGYIFTDKCFINNLGSISHGIELRSYDESIDRSRVPDSVIVVFKETVN